MLLCTHLIDVDIYCIQIKDFKFYFFSINPDYHDLQSLQNYLKFFTCRAKARKIWSSLLKPRNSICSIAQLQTRISSIKIV